MNKSDFLMGLSAAQPCRLSLRPGSTILPSGSKGARFYHFNAEIVILISGQVSIAVEEAMDLPGIHPFDGRPLFCHNANDMPDNTAVRDHMIRYLQGEDSLKRFVKWLMPLYIEHSLLSDGSPELLNSIQHSIAEFSSGLVNRSRLNKRLAQLASTVYEPFERESFADTVAITFELSAQLC